MTGAVTDNEKAMVAMKQNLVETDTELTVYGCSAYWLNLLGQDVTPSQIISQVIEVNKFVRNKHVPSALLAEIPESVMPQLPAETRWNSQLTCIDTYTSNRPSLKRPLPEDDSPVEPATKLDEPSAKRMRMVQSSMI